jgi:hypothetical protein
MKRHIDDKEATEQLRKAGWTAPEIERLRGVRRDYIEQERGKIETTHRRPAFVRWLQALLQEGLGPTAPWW